VKDWKSGKATPGLANSREGHALDKSLDKHGSYPVNDAFTAREKPLHGTAEDKVGRAMTSLDNVNPQGTPRPVSKP
jgi:hypothetical protein